MEERRLLSAVNGVNVITGSLNDASFFIQRNRAFEFVELVEDPDGNGVVNTATVTFRGQISPQIARNLDPAETPPIIRARNEANNSQRGTTSDFTQVGTTLTTFELDVMLTPGQQVLVFEVQAFTDNNPFLGTIVDTVDRQDNGQRLRSTLTLDQQAPTVVLVTSNSTNRTYSTGEEIDVRVRFSEAINVTGAPAIRLETGTVDRNAEFVQRVDDDPAIAGQETLVFRYVVRPGDQSPDLDYTNTAALTGGTIVDAAGNAAVRTLPTPGAPGSLGANKDIVIDAPTPDAPDLAPEDDTGPVPFDASNITRFNEDEVTRNNTGLTFTGDVPSGTSRVDLVVRNRTTMADQVFPTTVTGSQYSATVDVVVDPSSDTDFDVFAVYSFPDTEPATSQTLLLRIDQEVPDPLDPPDLINDTAGPGGTSTDDITNEANPTFLVPGTEVDASVTLRRNAVRVRTEIPESPGERVMEVEDPMSPAGTHQYTVIQTDLAGNDSVESGTTTVVVDLTPPQVANLRLSPNDQVARDLPVPVTFQTRPTLTFDLTDQRFRPFDKENLVVIELFEQPGGPPLGRAERTFEPIEQMTDTPMSGPNVTATFMDVTIRPDADLAPGAHSLFVVATDASGRPTTTMGFVFVISSIGAATPAAPATPVFSTRFSGLATNMHPWQTTFDNSTQTIWFTMEHGNRIAQMDPATGEITVYNLDNLSQTDGDSVDNPHGIFFDFNTHLTPRVWFVHRNSLGANAGAANEGELARLTYFDISKQEFVWYDFKDDPRLSALGVVDLHAVFVDSRGDVWAISDHDVIDKETGEVVHKGNRILQFDFDQGGVLNSSTANLVIREVPAFGGSEEHDFHPHGLEVIIDDQTGEAFVWFVAEGGSGRLGLLRVDNSPANREDLWTSWVVPEAFRNVRGTFVKVDDNETPGTPQDDRIVMTLPVIDAATPGGETPGAETKGIVHILDPGAALSEFDRIVDVPALLRSWTIPIVPGTSVSPTMQDAAVNQPYMDRSGDVFFIDRLSGVGRFDPDELSTDDPALQPGGEVLAQLAGPMHVPAPLGPILIVPSETASVTADAEAARTSPVVSTPPLTAVFVDPMGTPDSSKVAGLDQYVFRTTPARTTTRGSGPFRGFLNASNVLYGTFAQSDQIGTTVFAETARRQVAVVQSPNHPLDSPNDALPAGALRGRMVFQVLRDGSLVMSSRPDGSILDQQINLTALLSQFGEGPLPDPNDAFEELLIDGEPSAVVANDERVLIFGKSHDQRTLVVYEFDIGGEIWTADNLHEMANWRAYHLGLVDDPRMDGMPVLDPAVSGFPVGDPSAFVDSTGRIRAFVTTNTGHLLVYSEMENQPPTDLSLTTPHDVYAAVDVVEQAGVTYVYGTDQQGNLIEFAIPLNSATAVVTQVDVAEDPADPRATMVFQDVYATVYQGVRHVFAGDGNSRLVHVEVTGATALPNARAENVSNEVVANNRAFGYFDFQKPYAGRVYSGLSIVEGSDGALYVYGTNGRDMVEFRLVNGTWTAANLTNDVLASSHQPSNGLRQPANEVFGAPAAYVIPRRNPQDTDPRVGDRHILQINADGEVVEYYRLAALQQFQTQNITLRLGNSPTLLQGASSELIVAGANAGSPPEVRVFDRVIGGLQFSRMAYDANFRGGVRVASGDLTGDGIPDVITGAGPGAGPEVRVFDGKTGDPLPGRLGSFMAYNPAFRGGIFVASGDFNNDMVADIVTGADAGGGPHVRIFNGIDGSLMHQFFAYSTAFRGGVRVAVGDVDGDSELEVITGAGAGGGPQVRVFEPDGTRLQSFFAFNPAFRGGVYVASGNLNADANDDLIVGAGEHGGPQVRAFSGLDLRRLASFLAYDPKVTSGVRVASADIDGDDLAEILVSPGRGARPAVKAFEVTGDLVSSFVAFSSPATGAFIASSPRTAMGAPLRLSGFAGGPGGTAVNGGQLANIVDAAISRWSQSGLPEPSVQALRRTPVRLADLPAGVLGLATDGGILIDRDGGGVGWFVDPTPMADEEFLFAADAAGMPAIAEAALGRVDLLSTVLHELGHVMGLDDVAGESGAIMGETLSAGVRRLLSADLIDQVFTA